MASIVFDLDGTLVDSAPDIHAAVNRMLAEEGAAPMDLAQVCGFIGNGVPVLVQRVMQAHSWPAEDHPRLLSRFMTHYDAAPAELTRLYPGVAAALDRLAAAGHRFALCTNKPAATSQSILRHLGIAGHFPVIVGGDSLPQRKPDPAPLKAAFNALGALAGWYIGDSEVDAETAQSAGAPLVLFTLGYRKTPVEEIYHAARFDSFDQLPALLERLIAE